jgi:nitroreductase
MSVKSAKTEVPIHELLKERWSPRAFADELIEREKINSLFEAARWSPSCFNEQPWHFIIATKDSEVEYQRILSCLTEKNQEWAMSAPLVGIAVANIRFERNQKVNRHSFYDTGQALAHLTFQACELGLHVHQMAGFKPSLAKEEFDIPEWYDPMTAFVVGYLGEPERIPEAFRTPEGAPRSRKRVSDFVFTGKWGQTSELIE